MSMINKSKILKVACLFISCLAIYYFTKREYYCDPITNLSWTTNDNQNICWEDAAKFIKKLNDKDSSISSWRFPSINELQILYANSYDSELLDILKRNINYYIWTDEFIRKDKVRIFDFELSETSSCTFFDSEDMRVFAVKNNEIEKNLPFFSSVLSGNNPVRIKNPNNFSVKAGLRLGWKGKNYWKGKNLSIQPHGKKMVYVPNGPYEIYFIYSNEPATLFQGDSFDLNNNGIEIQIVQVPYGNYNIRQVK